MGGWGCVLFLLFDLRPNYGGGNEDNGNLLHMLSAPDLAAGHTKPTSALHRFLRHDKAVIHVRVPTVYINVGKHSSNMEKVPKVPSRCLVLV